MTTIYTDKPLPERHKNDLYQTERNLIRAAYATVFYNNVLPPIILDIGAGDGRWGLLAKEHFGGMVIGVELEDLSNPGFDLWYPNTDFLEWQSTYQFGLIVSNPPYYIAEEIIRKGFSLLQPHGVMIMLLRLAFQAGVGRYKNLWQTIYPKRLSVLSRRPSFYGGGTNDTDYGIYIWEKDLYGNPVGTPGEWPVKLLNYERDNA